jgi:C4-dicarboxylate-specific signal transduction histidine kinase
MNIGPPVAKDENLQFFGKVMASISHEIKNVMAIINEKSGLIKDLTLIAQKGMPLDVNRVQSIADDLRTQIKRADTIVKNMNKFAHSVDEEMQEVNLSELTGLMTLLAERTVSRLGVSLHFQPVPSDIIIRTRPFLLEFMIWKCIELSMDRCGETKSVNISLEKKEHHAQLLFMIDNKSLEQTLPTKDISWLMESLQAGLTIHAQESQLILSLPDKLAE